MIFLEMVTLDAPAERAKREKKAASAECTPLSLDKEKQTGVFKGSGGSYNTSLDSCSCRDNILRRLPCKHMYRLAAELGIIDLGNLKSDTSKLKLTKKEREERLEKVIAIIDSYPEKTQREIQLAIYQWKGGAPFVSEKNIVNAPLADGILDAINDPVAVLEVNTQKRTVEGLLAADFVFPENLKTTKKARYEWCLEHPDVACAIVYPNAIVVSLSGFFEPVALKVYTYLNKKFNPEDYEGGEDIVIKFKAF